MNRELPGETRRKPAGYLYRLDPDGTPAESWGISEAPLIVGRGSCAQACIDDRALSRSHFMVLREGEAFFVVDLESQNGTWVNDERTSGRRISPRDCIRAGESLFYFSAERLPLHARPMEAYEGWSHPVAATPVTTDEKRTVP